MWENFNVCNRQEFLQCTKQTKEVHIKKLDMLVPLSWSTNRNNLETNTELKVITYKRNVFYYLQMKIVNLVS